MHSKTSFHNLLFGMGWNPGNIAMTLLLTLLFLIFLLLFLTLTAEPVQGQSYQVLYAFNGNPGNGAGPAFPSNGVTMDRLGNIYGATQGNGTLGQFGSVYKLSHSGSQWLLTALHIFYDWDTQYGESPGGITVAQNGSVYGVAAEGGSGSPPGNGTFFNIRPQPEAPRTAVSPWLTTVLYAFQGQPDSSGPNWVLTFDGASNIYGAAGGGGLYGAGTVYELTESNGQWAENILYNFTGGSDGGGPGGGVILDNAGNLYGTTGSGGNPTCQGPPGCGVVFELTPSGSGWTETVLYTFQDGDDGAYPSGGLVFDHAGNLYGMTKQGGTAGWGTVYELSPSDGGWSFNVLYNFPAVSVPSASLITDSAGDLYGVIGFGGLYGNGTIFELTPSDGGWTYRDLYDFPANGGYGTNPNGPLYMDTHGNLYGTTQAGGDYQVCESGCGVVFEITP